MNRRHFGKTLAGLSTFSWTTWGSVVPSGAASGDATGPTPEDLGSFFPAGAYTPFGYLDNPYHSWALNRSGILRSVPAIGFGLYYPAGPGGYFNYERNSIYRTVLRVGFRIGEQVFFEESDFRRAGIELTSPHHSKNILALEFSASQLKVTVPFFLIGEDTLAWVVRLENTGAKDLEVQVYAVQKFEFGAATWWGRDGIAGSYDGAEDQVVLHAFAAGPVFALKSDLPSVDCVVTPDDAVVTRWMRGSNPGERAGTAYFPKGLSAGLSYHLRVPAGNSVECTLYLSRGVNERLVAEEAHSAHLQASRTLRAKHAEDDLFWSRAPQLEGDFPAHWKHSWVYDFETLRMMVRRPLGLYKHPWDAMQIQAPRNVLAETSLDMWALSYADAETAKVVLLGQFQDALQPNVPCMREDGTMNMVAADGSECGTSLQWCYPFYCLESVYLRTLDRVWLAQLYPYLAAHLEWTLKNRRDPEGWIVAKCSWETGMDASERFLIKQPTGGELIDFVRVAELQAAMSHAARAMKQFAVVLGKAADFGRWDDLAVDYAEKARRLWHEGWFYDQDARAGRPIVIPGHREVTQVGPVMCGVAMEEQVRAMIPQMREYESHQKFWLEWPSHVLPYAESVWKAGDREFLSRVLYELIDRVYTSMDRREVQPEKKLGWPGVSCEVWGVQGACGAEGYGWGATLPAHIIRSIFGFREGNEPDQLWFILGPNLPDNLAAKGKSFGVRHLHYRGKSFDLRYERQGDGTLRAELTFTGGWWPRRARVIDEAGMEVTVAYTARNLAFRARNHELYRVDLAE